MKDSKFKKEILVFLGAFLCCFLWGSAFPSIKIGYQLWHIAGDDTWRIIRFAGVRFFLAGVLVILFGSILKKRFLWPKREELSKIAFLSLFQTIGQYICFYLGLAHTTGVNSAVVDSLTNFFAILMASLIFRMEQLTTRKVLGCLLGITGVILINITGEGFTFNLLGDGLVALSALCYGMSSSLIKKYSAEHDTVLFSGYQFMFGGLVMVLVSLAGGMIDSPAENMQTMGIDRSIEPGMDHSVVTAQAILILLYLAFISSVAYTLWGILLRSNDVSKISIFGFMNPVIGVILSALFLKEAGQLGWRHVLALVLVSAGIVVVNRKGKANDKNIDQMT